MTQQLNLEALAERINQALKHYSDKDWNYSRIRLVTRSLPQTTSPYLIWYEMLDLTSQPGKQQLKNVADEVKWGDRHSNELGLLELVSLRLNKALLESSSDDDWHQNRPVLRVAKTEELAQTGVTSAFWYDIEEVVGDQFDNR